MDSTVHIDGKPVCFSILDNDGKGFDITINGSQFATRVVKNNGNSVTIEVNGRTHVVGIDGEIRDTALTVDTGADRMEVQTAFLADLRGMTKDFRRRQTLRRAQTDAYECRDLNGAVVASMPGKVVSVVAGIGDRIEENQVVCTLEAMKMQNEILAPVAGTIREICCASGDLVEKGDILFRIG